MNPNANRLALALAGATAILWIICSALVAIMPGPMMTVAGYMVHADLEAFRWQLAWGGFFVGLFAWALSAALSGWLIGQLYGRLRGSNQT